MLGAHVLIFRTFDSHDHQIGAPTPSLPFLLCQIEHPKPLFVCGYDLTQLQLWIHVLCLQTFSLFFLRKRLDSRLQLRIHVLCIQTFTLFFLRTRLGFLPNTCSPTSDMTIVTKATLGATEEASHFAWICILLLA